MSDTAHNDRCPRCGTWFHCGAHDAAPCACASLTLDLALLAALRARYVGCLCLHCLRECAAAGVDAEVRTVDLPAAAD